MARYIDADLLLTDEKTHTLPIGCGKASGNVVVFVDDIEKLTTADVVEVVRCKDCKHATFYSCKNDACYKGIICEYQIAIGDENFFCACGEARTPKERDMEK